MDDPGPFLSKGGSGWRRISCWKKGHPQATGAEGCGRAEGAAKDGYVCVLHGDGEVDGSLGTKGSGLAEGEAGRLRKAGVLMFRVPYDYTRKRDFKEASAGFRIPKKGAKLARGENGRHIPVKGSRRAIETALEIRRSGS